MLLNSLDIQNMSFSSALRGYDKADVDDFLDLLIRDYDTFSEKIKDQENEIRHLKQRAAHFSETQELLTKSIGVAQNAAEHLKVQADLEATSIKKEAADKAQYTLEATIKEASRVLSSASEDARRLVRETNQLKRSMKTYHQRMVDLVEAQLGNIKAMEWQEILRPATALIQSDEAQFKKIVEVINENTVKIQTEVG